MSSYPQSPGDGDNDQTQSSPRGSDPRGYGPPGAGGDYQQGGYPSPGGYPAAGAPGGYPGGAAAPGGQSPPYYGQPGGYPGNYPPDRGSVPGGPSSPNFFTALFDMNFSRFATPSVIKILYILIMVVVGLVWLSYVVLGFTVEPVLGILAFVGGAVVALLTITFYRVVLEFFYAVIRMSEDIHNRR